jgi:hypothetical protein
MGFFENMLIVLRSSFKERSQAERLVCKHGPTKRPFTITVLGLECKFGSSPYCIPCSEEYLNRFSTVCDTCGRPILPGTAVGQAADKNAVYPYTHNTFDCREPDSSICGKWGEGKLISLATVHPDVFPPG